MYLYLCDVRALEHARWRWRNITDTNRRKLTKKTKKKQFGASSCPAGGAVRAYVSLFLNQ